MARDQAYVIDLCDDVLGRTAQREHRFDFLRGDPNARGLCVRLPVDAYYAHIRLVIEYWERQHTESVAHFDRRQTISGMTRAAQRRRYDERRRTILPANGIRLIILRLISFRTTGKNAFCAAKTTTPSCATRSRTISNPPGPNRPSGAGR